MRKNKSLERVRATVEAYKNDTQQLEHELGHLVREGKKTGDVVLVGGAYYQLAYICFGRDDIDGIFLNSIKAVAMLEDTDQYDELAKASLSLGYAYLEQENPQMAILCMEGSLRIIKKHRVKGKTKILTMNNLSTCYHTIGDCKTAIKLLTDCLEQVKQETPDDLDNIAMYMINLAECYKDDGEIEKTGEILSSMADWIDTIKFKPLICSYYLRRAILAYATGDDASGGGFIDRALDLIPENIYPRPIYEDLKPILALLVEKGDSERSKKVFDVVNVLYENDKTTPKQLLALRTMAHYYKSTGRPELAADYYEKAEALHERRKKEMQSVHLNVHKRMKNAEAEIRKLSHRMKKNEELIAYEPMTKLLNRAAMYSISAEYIAVAVKDKEKIGGIFIDIDNFKKCNDTYGHTRGDEIIKEVARACREEVGPRVRFSRYGGDEFFGVALGLPDEEIKDIARRICRRIKAANIPNEHNPRTKRVTLSVGLVNVPVTAATDTIIEIANFADKAVYYAKSMGKDAIYLLDYNETEHNASFVKIDY